MKVKNGFIVYESGGEYIMTGAGDANFHGIIRSNQVAAFIVECLKEETTKEAILEKMLSTYEGEKEEMEKGIDSVLDTLRQIGVLDE